MQAEQVRAKPRVLIIEDQEGVATAIEHQLRQIGSFQIDITHSVVQALDRISALRNQGYDVILCDYNLGECTNGQQLLEYLRAEKRIPRRTGYIMITAEASYGAVSSAVELAPDAYLLKPFTQAGLEQRVSYVLSKNEALRPVHDALDQAEPDLPAAVSACNALVLAANRFALDALKIKAECLIRQNLLSEAATVYDKIIAWRPTPWAEVGRARTLRLMGYPELAEDKLKSTLGSFPKFVAAYDEMAFLASERGETQLAQQILERAHNIVPSNRRSRELGVLALENGDNEQAARFLKIVTERDRHGLKRSTEDFFGLSRALCELGRHAEALEVLDSLKQHFPENRALTVRKMAAEASTMAAAGKPGEAKRRVREALELLNDHMDPRAQIELAQACHHCGEVTRGNEIFIHVAENWQESAEVVNQVKKAMSKTSSGEAAAAIIEESLRELVRINNEAARQMKAGHLDEALENMARIAKRLLNNATVQANYTQALLQWIDHAAPQGLMKLPLHSKPRQYLTTAREHLRRLAKIQPSHPRLAPLQRLLARLTGEGECADEGVDTWSDESGSMEVGE